MSNRTTDHRTRIQQAVDNFRANPDVHKVEATDISDNLWCVTAADGSLSVYFHYSKWYKRADTTVVHFQASKNVTNEASSPLVHAFLGSAEEAIRFVRHDDLFDGRFTINLDHDDGKQWRLSLNCGQNDQLLISTQDDLPLPPVNE
jgi:hypothetical protein